MDSGSEDWPLGSALRCVCYSTSIIVLVSDFPLLLVWMYVVPECSQVPRSSVSTLQEVFRSSLRPLYRMLSRAHASMGGIDYKGLGWHQTPGNICTTWFTWLTARSDTIPSRPERNVRRSLYYFALALITLWNPLTYKKKTLADRIRVIINFLSIKPQRYIILNNVLFLGGGSVELYPINRRSLRYVFTHF